MKKLAALFLLGVTTTLDAQNTTYDSAYFAWERGNYIAALDGMLRVLRSPQAAAYQERIALLTGELFKTVELAADGRNVRWRITKPMATSSVVVAHIQFSAIRITTSRTTFWKRSISSW